MQTDNQTDVQKNIINLVEAYDRNVDVICALKGINEQFYIDLLKESKYDILWNQLVFRHIDADTKLLNCNKLFKLGEKKYIPVQFFYNNRLYLYRDFNVASNLLKVRDKFIEYIKENKIMFSVSNQQRSSYRKIKLAVPIHLASFFYALICVWNAPICRSDPFIGVFCENNLLDKYFKEFPKCLENIDDKSLLDQINKTEASVWKNVEFNSTLFKFVFQIPIKNAIQDVQEKFLQMQYEIIKQSLTQRDQITEWQYQSNKINYKLLDSYQNGILNQFARFAACPYFSMQKILVTNLVSKISKNFFTEEDLQKKVDIYDTCSELPAELEERVSHFTDQIKDYQGKNEQWLKALRDDGFLKETVGGDVFWRPQKDLCYIEAQLEQRWEECYDDLLQIVTELVCSLAESPWKQYVISDIDVYYSFLEEFYSDLLGKKGEALIKLKKQYERAKEVCSQTLASIASKSRDCLSIFDNLNIELNKLSDYTMNFFKNTTIKRSRLMENTKVESYCDKKFRQLIYIMDDAYRKMEYCAQYIPEICNRTSIDDLIEEPLSENLFVEIFKYLEGHNYFK